jgi:hypothetical protein
MGARTFDIGLVGAGAISAGAYSAGVLDFLLEALDEWYAAKAAGHPVPMHDVRLSVFAGASAGGITAALGSACLASDQPRIRDPQAAQAQGASNKLYDSWVRRIDIEHLLASRDLEDPAKPVLSLLDSTVLGEIAEAGLQVQPRPRRPYVADDFHLLMTVTNLRGVPYSFPLAGSSHAHQMRLHGDYLHFVLNDSGELPGAIGQTVMRWQDLGQPGPARALLADGALASGAFPLGLAPRHLRHAIAGAGKPDLYSERRWPVPTPDSPPPHQCIEWRSIPPAWEQRKDFEYGFTAVDGGVINNEPLELARRILAGPAGHSPRDAWKADRAMLMIDPFPTMGPENWSAPKDLAGLALRLFGALKNQARFKVDELMLAAGGKAASRYLIAPSRDGQRHAIASGSLGGFGGFLQESFRAHDFFLGRRNAQWFLRKHFVLPSGNPLFGGPAESGAMLPAFGTVSPDGQPALPIIPLTGTAEAECMAPAWPHYTEEELALLRSRIEKRSVDVLMRMAEQTFDLGLARPLVKLGARQAGKKLAAWAGNQVREQLSDMAILR